MASHTEEIKENTDKVEAVKPNTDKAEETDSPDSRTEKDDETKKEDKSKTETEEGKSDRAEGGTAEETKKNSEDERHVIGQELGEEKEAASKKDLENIDLSKEVPLDEGGRMKMFEEGLQLDKEGQKTEALKCYLKCLVGLKENSRFSLLPQCLRNIGDIYYNKDEYDKAISFIQAEKLYYESVLIDDTQLQKHIEEVMAKSGDQASADPDLNIDSMRAAEYEQLAKLCMDEKQPQLALEYAGKATKLRQQVYGDGHPLVQQSLDYFATVYAEVGKVQYAESMSKYAAAGEPDMTGGATLSNSSEPTSILRKRKGETGDREKKVRFDESQVPSAEVLLREEKCAWVVLLLLFISLCFFIILLGLYIYCYLDKTPNCAHYRQFLQDCLMRVRYWYYHYFSSDDVKYA